MKLTQIGEFGLIRKLREELRNFQGDKVTVGIGDDAAAVETQAGELTLLTTDTLVEDVHFKWDYTSPFEVGWKSLAVNISDIAAMGGNPLYALITLSLPLKPKNFDVENLYKGLKKIASQYKVKIVGGDIVRSPIFTITVSLIGEVKKENILLRSGAKKGDLIYVTGELGSSRAGLECLRNLNLKVDPEIRKFLVRKHLLPSPKLKEGQILAKEKITTAAIDISDGLVSDLFHVTEESKVGAILWEKKIPFSPVSKAVAEQAGTSPLKWALYGGEDYELLFTISRDKKEKIKELESSSYLIGEIVEEKGVSLIKKGGGAEVPLEDKGYDHFKIL